MKSHEPYEVREARPGTGKGLFATAPFSKGDFIIEYTGVRIPTKEADFHRGRYLFEIDEQWTIDGEPSSNPARYVNHCCDPNAEAKIVKDEVGKHIMFFAVRDIAPGEEFTIDYGEEYYNDFIKPEGCKCAAKVHRG
jgi:SET domain-containing protein